MPSSEPDADDVAPSARRVLIVDDDPNVRTLAETWLRRAGHDVAGFTSAEAALGYLEKTQDDIGAIVLDVMMPGHDGFWLLSRIKAAPNTADVPVVLLTAHANSEAERVRGIEIGADDHLEKPFSGPVLVARVNALTKRRDTDRTLRTRLQQAESQATTDALTGLGNRRNFDDALARETAYCQRHRVPLALAILDLDHFKSINDQYGHDDGDRVLVFMAKVLKAELRRSDEAFRIGGEEFAVLLRASSVTDGAAVVDRIRGALAGTPLRLGDSERSVTFSAGVAAADADNEFSTASLFRRADQALYAAKSQGRDRVVIAERA